MSELDPRDPILSLLGAMDDVELEQRQRIHHCREIASHRIAHTDSPSATPLLWMVIEWATANVYSSASVEHLTKVAGFCRRLLITAMQAERIEVSDGLA